METIKRLLLLTTCISLLITCTPYDIFRDDDYVTVTIPLEADFSVWNHTDWTDNRCGDYPNFFFTVEGDGQILNLGNITTRMTFCVNIDTGYYYDTVGSFVFDNGDKLFYEIPKGQIMPNEGDDSNYYQSIFDDLMIFTGGTGRFESASGDAMSNAFVHWGPDEWRTDFFSEGTLMIIQRKR